MAVLLKLYYSHTCKDPIPKGALSRVAFFHETTAYGTQSSHRLYTQRKNAASSVNYIDNLSSSN